MTLYKIPLGVSWNSEVYLKGESATTLPLTQSPRLRPSGQQTRKEVFQ